MAAILQAMLRLFSAIHFTKAAIPCWFNLCPTFAPETAKVKCETCLAETPLFCSPIFIYACFIF